MLPWGDVETGILQGGVRGGEGERDAAADLPEALAPGKRVAVQVIQFSGKPASESGSVESRNQVDRAPFLYQPLPEILIGGSRRCCRANSRNDYSQHIDLLNRS
jgi:hypothetical protein